jgi:hypothetical protein
LACEGSGKIGRETVGFANLGIFPRKGLSDAISKPLVSTGDERNPLLQPHAAARATVCHFLINPLARADCALNSSRAWAVVNMALYLGH